MLSIRSARERGRSDLGWLDSRHTFSFGRYFDPEHMGFGPLRVINEDRVAPGRGFEAHGHRDMEILSIVLSGELEHRDSMGNHSAEEPVHFLQIWIEPEATGLAPGYEQRNFESRLGMPEPALLASRDGRDGSLTIHQDVDLLAIRLPEGASLSLPVRPGRSAWVQVLRGGLALAGASLGAGDGAALADVSDIRIDATTSLDVLVFDMNASATHRGR
jgi:hypothetical protein